MRVLNNRLTSFVKNNEILLENQCGFCKGYQTVHHIFTLSTLIDHYVNKMTKVMVFNDKSWKNAGKYCGCIAPNKFYIPQISINN